MKFLKMFFAGVLGMLGFTTVHAALPLVVGTTLTDIQVDSLALIDLLWPVVGVITGGFILIKIFKRGSSKI